jgi:hypothetical protein
MRRLRNVLDKQSHGTVTVFSGRREGKEDWKNMSHILQEVSIELVAVGKLNIPS